MLKYNLPIVFYGCKTWSLTEREEHRLRVFENRVLRKIFGPTGDTVTEELRKIHNEDLYDLCPPPNMIGVIKMERWAGHVARMGDRRGSYWALEGRSERHRPLGRPRRRWEDDIKMSLQQVGRGGMDWIDLRRILLSPVMNHRVP
jgi:hypothetical protein